MWGAAWTEAQSRREKTEGERDLRVGMGGLSGLSATAGVLVGDEEGLRPGRLKPAVR